MDRCKRNFRPFLCISCTTRFNIQKTLPSSRIMWAGRAAATDNTFCTWPPRSPDLTVCDFFLWGFVKDSVYILPLLKTLLELQERINTAIRNVKQDMLGRLYINYQLLCTDYYLFIKILINTNQCTKVGN